MPDPADPQRDAGAVGSSYPAATQTPTGPILVATDGTALAEPAFRAASAISAKSSVDVQVIVVMEPLPVLLPQPSLIAAPLVASPALLDTVRNRAVTQMRESAPEGSNWQVEVEYGRPSAEIAKKARDRNAQLIVMGLVHHGLVDRLLDGDTALEVVRQSRTPVLLASASLKTLATRAVFAVDFSAQSIQAARVGLRILSDGSEVILAHVAPMLTVFDGTGIWEEEYEQAATKELGKFAEALSAPAGIRVEQVMLRGSPAWALLSLSDRTKADLIVAGTRGAGLMQRLLLGSVATRLMRHSTRSLLIVPDLEE